MINKIKVELNEYKEISTCLEIISTINICSNLYKIENKISSIHNKYFHSFEFDLINIGFTSLKKEDWIYELQFLLKDIKNINMGNVFIYFDDEVERLNFKL